MTRTQIVEKNSENSNCDKTQKLKWGHNSKTQIVTTQNLNVTKLQNSNCDKTQNSNCDQTKKNNIATKLKRQIVIKLKKSNCEEKN